MLHQRKKSIIHAYNVAWHLLVILAIKQKALYVQFYEESSPLTQDHTFVNLFSVAMMLIVKYSSICQFCHKYIVIVSEKGTPNVHAHLRNSFQYILAFQIVCACVCGGGVCYESRTQGEGQSEPLSHASCWCFTENRWYSETVHLWSFHNKD